MSGIVKFGEDVEGYRLPVLNEREIRAAAGLLFVLMFSAIAAAVLKGSFVLLKSPSRTSCRTCSSGSS